MNKNQNWFGTLLGYAEGQGGKFAASIVLSVISIIAGLGPYFCLYKLVELFVLEAVTSVAIIRWCVSALLFYAVKVLFFSWSTGLSHQVAYHVVAGLRKQIMDRFLHAPLGAVQKLTIGEIKNIIVDKVALIEPPLAHMVPEGAGHIVLPLVSLIALWMLDWHLALAALVTAPAAIVCMLLTFVISGKSFQRYNESNAYMNSTIVEYIEGIEVIKAFGRAGVSYEKYASSITDFRTFVLKWMASTWVTMKLAFALLPSTLLGVLPMSVYLVSKGSIGAAEAALAVMLSMSMVTSLARLEVFSENLNQMQNNVLALQEYLTMESLPEPDENAELTDYTVELKNVHFSYNPEAEDPKEVLHGINLTLPQKQFTALVGPSGSGKSTIAKLIARFWDVTDGAITIGGVDIRQMPLAQLSDCVSFVTQDNFLFRCSLLENIRVGNPQASDEEVKAAARAAQCEDFILKLPQGYDTPAGEAGKRLSGGEKQRIAIVRMMLKNAPIVILDEATAFTDPENEDKIQQSIAELTKDKTLLVIAHRLSTIRKANTIVVLQDGRIVDQGHQDELLERCPLYQTMWQAHIGAKHWAVSSAQMKESEV